MAWESVKDPQDTGLKTKRPAWKDSWSSMKMPSGFSMNRTTPGPFADSKDENFVVVLQKAVVKEREAKAGEDTNPIDGKASRRERVI